LHVIAKALREKRKTEIILPGGAPVQTVKVLTGNGRDWLPGNARRTAATRGV
jgi:hypothetical protein